MEILKIRALSGDQFDQINQLWNEEFPSKLNDRFRLFLDDIKVNNHYIIESPEDVIVAWAIDFEREYDTWFSILVKADQQGKGLGKLLINHLKEDLKVMYGWVIDHDHYKKVNGENYKSPIAFYIQMGFEILGEDKIDNDVLKAVKIRYSSSRKA